MTVLGLYSNYTLVTNALASAITLLVAAMKGSIGNLIATGDNEKSYKIFKALNLLMMWFIGFLFIGIMVCVQDFISILGGDSSKQLPYLTVVLICLNFYVTQSRTMANNFKECAGLFWNDRFKPLFEAGINLGLDLLLVYFMGINGVILATIISTVTVPLWVEPYVLYKNYFKQHLYKYFLQYIFYILSTAASFGVTFFACYFIPHGGIGWFILRVVICLILPNLVYLLIYFKTPEFTYLFSAVKALFDRFGNKRATAQPSIDSDTANENNLKAEEQQNYESDTQSD